MGFDVQKALDAGYTQMEIDSHMSNNDIEPSKPVETAPVEAARTTESGGLEVDIYPDGDIPKAPVSDEPTVPTEKPILDIPEGGQHVQNTSTNVAQAKPVDKAEFAKQQAEQIMDLSDLYKNRHQKYSTQGKSLLGTVGGLSSTIAGALKSDEMKMSARRDVVDLNKHIASKLKEEGFDAFISPDTGDLMFKDAEGNEQEIDSSMLNDLWNSKHEMVGAIGGAIAGASAGNTATAGVPPVTLPTALVKGGAIAGGALVGGFVGAGSGRALDLVNNSLQLKENLEAGLVMRQAVEAGYYDTVSTIVGGTALKVGGKLAKGGWRLIGRAHNLVANGNSKGALKYLKDSFNLSDDAAKEITQKFIDTLAEEPVMEAGKVGKMFGGKMRPLNETEKQILAITSTQEGGEQILATVTKDNFKVAKSMAENINTRAKTIQKMVASQSDDNVGMRIKEDLKTYEGEVKDFYAQVKHIGSEALDGTDFTFDMDKISMEGVIDGMKSNNKSNPDYLATLENFMDGINSRSTDRSFTGLIDLRQSVNDFKYSKLVSKTNKVKGKKTEFEAVNDILNSIDSQIVKGVNEYMPKEVAKEWTSQWKKSKEAYAKMSKLKKNAILSYVTRSTATEQGIQAQLNRYGNNLDVDAQVFNDMVEILNPKTKVKVENAAIKNLVNKHTDGVDAGMQALDFPALAEELSGLNITTKQGAHMVKTVNKLSKIYKNDATLSRVSGGVSLKQSGDSSIATTIEGKARAKIVHDAWRIIQAVNPTKNILNENALINKLDILMKDPLKQKSVESYINSVPKEMQEQTKSLVKVMQIELAKAGQKAEAKQTKGEKAFKKVYKQSSTGKLVKSKGKLGNGVYLVDKVKNPNPNSKVVGTEINLSKMLDVNSVSSELGREVTLKQIREGGSVVEELKAKGFEGLSEDGKFMLFEASN